MMRQYLELKEKHKDQILFFRLGDFYEMFYEDAKIASKELELTLTGRDCGTEERAPMCGVPHHSCEAYIARLVKKGYKVAICEQVEDPATAKGIVNREVVRIITPGTVIEGSMLDETRNNYIACLHMESDARAGLCFADISTGEVFVSQIDDETNLTLKIINEIGRFSPSEMLLDRHASNKIEVTDFVQKRISCLSEVLEPSYFEPREACETVLSHFGRETLEQLGLAGKTASVTALGALIFYLRETQKNGLERLININLYNEEQYMNLDLIARKNLELTQTMRTGDKRGTLLWVLDQTKTAMGKRLMRTYIEQPLVNCATITKRLSSVEELYDNDMFRQDIMAQLGGIFDLERLMTRIVYGSATPRELVSLLFTARRLPALKEKLAGAQATLLREIYKQIDTLEDVGELISSALIEDPPNTIKDGGVIKTGFDKAVDELREISDHGSGYLLQIEQREREATGIKNLKIGYNKIFGYYLEVTRSYLDQVPDTYIRKQTLTNCERYITQELKELEGKILGAKERLIKLEAELFERVRRQVADQLYRIQITAQAVAALDVTCSFAQVARANGYCRPDISADSVLSITEGRHPVVEKILTDTPFVPNDTYLDQRDNRVAIITGPNMAGKSTYMRQVALITLMAQIGSFVPAKSARIGIVDSIFTRVGASDDLSAGQSTFMVEMSEVAQILKSATPKSLLILDEIGRGTSTFDGMSIARAVVEHIADSRKLGAKTLFATHYHELTELEEQIAGVKNYNIAVKKRGDDITFLRRILRGAADDSYGIEVAKLAGVAEPIVRRAKEILVLLENGESAGKPRKKNAAQQAQAVQIAFGEDKYQEIADRLKRVDVDNVTARQALDILYELSLLLAKAEG